jgi:uncharacterized membrane protein
MPSVSKVLGDVFFGTQQSRYAAIAYFLTIAILCFAILFSSSDIPIEQRLLVVLFILIITIPSVLFSLFELTCIVTGGNQNTRWWCYWLAWFLSIMLIIYCLFIIISLFFSMASYDLAVSRINEDEGNKVSKAEANEYAKEIMQDAENKGVSNATGLPQMEPMNTFTPGNEVPQAPAVSQPVNMTPIMSNDIKNSEFGTMGYDRDDNLAPVSNTADMSAGFAPAIKPVDQTYLRPQNKFEPFANEPEAFAGNADNLQAY